MSISPAFHLLTLCKAEDVHWWKGPDPRNGAMAAYDFSHGHSVFRLQRRARATSELRFGVAASRCHVSSCLLIVLISETTVAAGTETRFRHSNYDSISCSTDRKSGRASHDVVTTAKVTPAVADEGTVRPALALPHATSAHEMTCDADLVGSFRCAARYSLTWSLHQSCNGHFARNLP